VIIPPWTHSVSVGFEESEADMVEYEKSEMEKREPIEMIDRWTIVERLCKFKGMKIPSKPEPIVCYWPQITVSRDIDEELDALLPIEEKKKGISIVSSNQKPVVQPAMAAKWRENPNLQGLLALINTTPNRKKESNTKRSPSNQIKKEDNKNPKLQKKY